jgi:Uma2 family endonuclease
MVQPALRFTRADYEKMPEDLRVELIEGELLKMAPPVVSHQRVVMAVLMRLAGILGEERLLPGPVGFAIDEWNVLVPDVVILEREPEVGAKQLEQAQIVVEVLSPSTARREREVKADLYLRAGVGEVWLVDLKARTIEIRSADRNETVGSDGIARSTVVAGLELPVQDLFR